MRRSGPTILTTALFTNLRGTSGDGCLDLGQEDVWARSARMFHVKHSTGTGGSGSDW